MESTQEKKIFDLLKTNFLRDTQLSTLNLLKKSAQEVKVSLKIMFENEDEIREAKEWVDGVVEIIGEDLNNNTEKYFNNFNFE